MFDVELVNNFLFCELFKLLIFWKVSWYLFCLECNFDKFKKLLVGVNFVKFVLRKFFFYVVFIWDVEFIINDGELDWLLRLVLDFLMIFG